VGAWGEEQACNFLTKHGYSILDRNCRYKLHELDIVALDPQLDEVVFVEVKTRSSGEFGEASIAVGRKKVLSMIKTAEIYMKENDLTDKDYRFDIITIVGTKINHYPNVTWEMVK
jgi:putative endonuclease